MANATIGFLTCPIMGDRAEVRRDKKRKLYYVGLAGKITPNLYDGQVWLQSITEFIGENGEPLKPVNEKQTEVISEKPPQISVNEKSVENHAEKSAEVKPETIPEKQTVNGAKSLMNFLFKE